MPAVICIDDQKQQYRRPTRRAFSDCSKSASCTRLRFVAGSAVVKTAVQVRGVPVTLAFGQVLADGAHRA